MYNIGDRVRFFVRGAQYFGVIVEIKGFGRYVVRDDAGREFEISYVQIG